METGQLVYEQSDLMQDHDGLTPHVVTGQKIHGGFLADGTYQPPRALVREQAFDAWTSALRDRGYDVFPADSSLLTGPRLPTVEQQRVLLGNGLGRTFWNGLTITGKIEARGRLLADVTSPTSNRRSWKTSPTWRSVTSARGCSSPTVSTRVVSPTWGSAATT